MNAKQKRVKQALKKGMTPLEIAQMQAIARKHALMMEKEATEKAFVDMLIEKLEEEYNQAEKDMGLSDTYNESSYCNGRRVAYKKAKYIVKALAEEHKGKDCSKCSRRSWYQKGYEDAKKNNGWIPVSERLPQENVAVLVCTDVGEIDVDYYGAFVKDFIGLKGTSQKALAWQPLPQPYKEGE